MKFIDAHNDFLIEIKDIKEKRDYIKYIKFNNSIKRICSSVWTTKYPNAINKLLECYNYSQINKKISISIEDIGFINKNNLNETVSIIKKINPVYCGLVWNYNNNLGGGCYSNNGLTKLGKEVIKILEKSNVIIDTAHMNKKTFFEFTKITNFPIFNSHTNFNLFKYHKRNLSDKQIKMVIYSNGFIGVCFVKNFIFDNLVNLKLIARELAVFINKYGDTNIGIGSDFYGTKDLPKDLKTYEDLKYLKKYLVKEGLSIKTINNIYYKNYQNYLKRIKTFIKNQNNFNKKIK